MKRRVAYFFVFFLSSVSVPIFAQERITITTYYPAPFGVYTNLRLFPATQPETKPCQEGTMYYDNKKNQVMVCGLDGKGQPTWQGIGLWTRQEGDVFLHNPEWNAGIGTQMPTAKLDVAGAIKIGTYNETSLDCNAQQGGMLRYNLSINNFEYCNGTRWRPFGAPDYESNWFEVGPNQFITLRPNQNALYTRMLIVFSPDSDHRRRTTWYNTYFSVVDDPGSGRIGWVGGMVSQVDENTLHIFVGSFGPGRIVLSPKDPHKDYTRGYYQVLAWK